MQIMYVSDRIREKKYKHKLSSNKPVYTQHPTCIVNYIVRIFKNDTHIGV